MARQILKYVYIEIPKTESIKENLKDIQCWKTFNNKAVIVNYSLSIKIDIEKNGT